MNFIQFLLSFAKRHKIFSAVVAAELVFLAAHFAFAWQVQSPVELVASDLIASTESAYLDWNGGLTIDEGNNEDDFGVYAQTPIFPLKKGSYRITVRYLTDGEAGKVEQLNELVTAAAISLDPTRTEMTFSLWAHGDTATNLDFYYNGVGRSIYGVSVVPTHSYAYTSTLLWLLALAVLDLIALAWRGVIPVQKLSPNARLTAGILAGILILSSIPLGLSYIPYGHDLPFHLARLQGLADGLSAGMFPVKIQPSLLQGNGYANGVFYGDLLLYIPAVLRIIGFSLQSCYKIYAFGINIATVLVSYFCFKKVFGSRFSGLLGSALYTLSTYRLVNLYLRCAVGEYTAMLFFPLIFFGLWRVLAADAEAIKAPGYRRFWIPITVGYTGLICSHALSCELVAIFTVFVCLICIKKVLRKETFWVLAKAVIYTSLLCLWFLVPFLDYSASGEFGIITYEGGLWNYLQNAVFPGQAFQLFGEGGGASYLLDQGMQSEMPLTVGAALLLGAAAFLLVHLHGQKPAKADGKESAVSRLGWICLALGALAIAMSLTIFPWYDISLVIPAIGTVIAKLQFPWRFLAPACLLLTVAAVAAFALLRSRYGKTVFGCACTLMAAMILMTSGYFLHTRCYTGSAYYIYDLDDIGQAGAQLSGGEYLPETVDIKNIWSKTRLVYDAGQVDLSDYRKDNLSVTLTAQNNTAEAQAVGVPLILYQGYRAVDSASGQALDVDVTEDGQVAVILPANYQGTFTVRWVEPTLWRVAEGISLVSLILLGSSGLWLRRRKKQA